MALATSAGPASGTKSISQLLEELTTLLKSPVDAASFEGVRSQLVSCVGALGQQLQFPVQSKSTERRMGLDVGLPGRQNARVILEMGMQSGAQLYAAAIWVERTQLVVERYGQSIAEQVMQVCSQQVISRMLRAEDQIFHWGGAGLMAVLQRDDNLPAVRSELMRVLTTPVNQYFETEHRTIYLPIRMSGELFPVTEALDNLQDEIQKYFSGRS